jgi:hypothetical protein
MNDCWLIEIWLTMSDVPKQAFSIVFPLGQGYW